MRAVVMGSDTGTAQTGQASAQPMPSSSWMTSAMAGRHFPQLKVHPRERCTDSGERAPERTAFLTASSFMRRQMQMIMGRN